MDLPGLKAEVETARPIALNDVSFIRRPHGRMAELSYRLGGQEVGHVELDAGVGADAQAGLVAAGGRDRTTVSLPRRSWQW